MLCTVQESLIPIGYERDSSVLGAPYDFRKAPNELQDWMGDFQKLIETTHDSNNNTPVVLLCHSMGAPMSLYLLQRMTQSWKDKYVKVCTITLERSSNVALSRVTYLKFPYFCEYRL